MRRFLPPVMLLASLGSACSSSSAPDEEFTRRSSHQLSSTDFAVELIRPGSAPIPVLQARGGAGSISVQGSVGTPYPCYDFDAFVENENGQLSLEVTATQQRVVCTAVVARFSYEAAIRELAPGRYAVHVTHVVDGHGTQALDTTVTVR